MRCNIRLRAHPASWRSLDMHHHFPRPLQPAAALSQTFFRGYNSASVGDDRPRLSGQVIPVQEKPGLIL